MTQHWHLFAQAKALWLESMSSHWRGKSLKTYLTVSQRKKTNNMFTNPSAAKKDSKGIFKDRKLYIYTICDWTLEWTSYPIVTQCKVFLEWFSLNPDKSRWMLGFLLGTCYRTQCCKDFLHTMIWGLTSCGNLETFIIWYNYRCLERDVMNMIYTTGNILTRLYST